MPSDKRNSITAKAMGLISSLSDIPVDNLGIKLSTAISAGVDD